MASTRSTLRRISKNLDESMGVRTNDLRPKLGPVPHAKDKGRKPLREVATIDVNQVVPDPDQPRGDFSEEAIDRLANSIREKGQLSAIRVRWSNELGKWLIIAGERRWRATKRAGLDSIDCYFHEGELSRSQVLEQQLIENCLREDLNPIEEAKAFRTLMELNNWTGKQLAQEIRVATWKVSRAVALLKLPTDIQDDVYSGQIPTTAAYELSKLNNDDARRALADKARAGELTHSQTATAVRARRGTSKPKSRGTKQVFLAAGGWKVTVSANRKGNYHDIESALVEALEEVRLRIKNNVQLF